MTSHIKKDPTTPSRPIGPSFRRRKFSTELKRCKCGRVTVAGTSYCLECIAKSRRDRKQAALLR